MPGQTWLRNIDAQGRVTIPAELRRQLGFRPGSRVVLVAEKDHIRLYPLREWRRLHRTRR
jgi:AbrB family looped-hinge helix DNA binding protein